ncbi:uncharacterized protein LOC131940891 [Physella acuta]|uniref:uncharacterized protein LOC131940891 n=1 Tax=Physella acuta TaxID=109671 RepID=UPI0027DAC0D4|nr:uncharacterized protein LOC131940891 [Physella acuta]
MGQSDDVKSEQDWVLETKTWYISDVTLKYLDLILTVTVHGLISVLGVASNAVNMKIFAQLGLRDSMSVGLFVLSFTDLAVTAMQVASCFSYLVEVVYPTSPIDPWSLGHFAFSWARYISFLISCWITTLITTERCFCVVFPFKVKQVFTIPRCILATLLIYVVHIGIHLPIYAYAQMAWVDVPEISPYGDLMNTSRVVFTVTFTELSATWEIIADMVAGVTLSVLSQVILIFCTLYMIYSLKKSSQIRKGEKSSSLGNDADTSGDNLSQRERRLVKVVLLLALVLTSCNVPRFMVIAIHHLFPGMNIGAYQNLNTILWDISYIAGTIYCSSTIFIYLKLNTSYRKVFINLFQPGV